MTKFYWNEKISPRMRKSGKNLFFLIDSSLIVANERFASLGNRYAVDTVKQSNDLETYNDIITTMLKRKMNGSTTLVAIGGGMIHDLGGFVAATFFRGIRWVYVPTTLTGMADSCVGGRCGLSQDGKDCVIGCNYPPNVVVFDYSLIKTLPQAEWTGGVCEIVRAGILSKRMLKYLEENVYSLQSRDEAVTKACLDYCRKVKRKALSKRCNKGGKNPLKVGRVIGMAIEHDDQKRRSRGEYLIFGTIIELSAFRSDVNPKYYDRVLRIIDKTALEPLDFSVETVVDKCFEFAPTGVVSIALPVKIGKVVSKKIDEATMLTRLNAFKIE